MKSVNAPDIKIDIDVIDDSPFFVRPFPIHEEDKPMMDKYMAKLVSLGILSKIILLIHPL